MHILAESNEYFFCKIKCQLCLFHSFQSGILFDFANLSRTRSKGELSTQTNPDHIKKDVNNKKYFHFSDFLSQ